MSKNTKNTETNDSPKKRGAKPGKRDRIFIAINYASGKITTEKLTANSVEEATEMYKKQYEANPKEIIGPFFDVKDSAPAPSLFISLANIRNIDFSSKNIRGTYKDYPCEGVGLKSFTDVNGVKYKDNEAFMITLDQSGPEGVRRPRLGTLPVLPLSAIQIAE